MKLTDELKEKIDAMSPKEMARISLRAPVDNPLFQGESGKYFETSFLKKGGMTPAIRAEAEKDINNES